MDRTELKQVTPPGQTIGDVMVTVVESDPEINRQICHTLSQQKISCLGFQTAAELLEAGVSGLLVLNHTLADMNARALISKLNERGLRPPFIVVVEDGVDPDEFEMMEDEAVDVVMIDARFSPRLARAVKRALDEIAIRKRLRVVEASSLSSAVQQIELIEKTPIPMVVFGADERIILINDLFIETFGYTLDDLSTTEDWWRYAYPDEASREGFKRRWRYEVDGAHDAGVGIPEFESAVVCRDGSSKQAVFSMMAIGDYSIVVIRDVTDERQAAARLRASEKKFATAFKNSPCIMTISDVDDGTLHEVNEGFVMSTGFDREAALGTTSVKLGVIQPEDRAKIMRELSDRGRASNLEIEFRRQDGSCFTGLFSGEVIAINGSSRLLSIILDISALKQAELDRLELEKRLLRGRHLERLGVLAGGVAHDFNNLLTGIIGNAELALNQVRRGTLEYTALNALMDGATRAADLSLKMLAYSGHGLFVKRPLLIQKLVGEVVFRAQLGWSESLRITVDGNAEDCAIEGDAAQVEDAVSHLLTNAAEAIGDEGGSIEVGIESGIFSSDELASPFSADVLPSGRYVCLSVRDDGEGMDEETLSHAFEPFYTTKFPGRGLGLAVVLGVVRAHGGTVNVESSPEIGSTVRVWLPCVGVDSTGN